MSSVAAATGAGAAAAAAAAIANAIKAHGGIIKLEPDEFKKILNKADKPLVAFAEGGFWGKNYQYMTNYKGLFFFCKTKEAIHLPGTVETIMCEKIMIPGQ
jgi:hypothetical protein